MNTKDIMFLWYLMILTGYGLAYTVATTHAFFAILTFIIPGFLGIIITKLTELIKVLNKGDETKNGK
jgi:hypothetical protein